MRILNQGVSRLALHLHLLQFGGLMLLCMKSLLVNGQGWTDAHATYYGGPDGGGTMGGACGYGNLYSTGYGLSTTALSDALFNNGLSCGACYQLICKTDETSYCYDNQMITVTATNECPQGSNGGWCDSPKQHFDLSYKMFTTLAQEVGGVIPVQYQRVVCQKMGGIRFALNGNPYWITILVTNVAGGGDISNLMIKGDNTDWLSMSQSWGQNWVINGQSQLCNQGISFEVTLGNGAVQKFYNVVSDGWSFSQTYEAGSNF